MSMGTTLNDARPVARKRHTCDDCRRVIEAGETYRRWTGIGDDGLYSWKSCAHCDRVATAIWALPDGPSDCDGLDVIEWLAEYDLEPLLTQMRAQWVGIAAADLDLSVLR